jgi:hypothetical protein
MERREALTPGTCHAMQFQVGDRFTDEKGEREVTNRPPSGWSRCSQPGSWPLSASSAPHLVCDLSSCPVRLAAVGSGRAHRRDWSCPGSVDGELLSRSSLHPLRG